MVRLRRFDAMCNHIEDAAFTPVLWRLYCGGGATKSKKAVIPTTLAGSTSGMSKTTDAMGSATDDALEQIRQLRAQLDELLSERVQPMARDAAAKLGAGLHDAREQAGRLAGEELAMVTRQVRDRPITALLAAAAVGFVLARLTR